MKELQLIIENVMVFDAFDRPGLVVTKAEVDEAFVFDLVSRFSVRSLAIRPDLTLTANLSASGELTRFNYLRSLLDKVYDMRARADATYALRMRDYVADSSLPAPSPKDWYRESSEPEKAKCALAIITHIDKWFVAYYRRHTFHVRVHRAGGSLELSMYMALVATTLGAEVWLESLVSAGFVWLFTGNASWSRLVSKHKRVVIMHGFSDRRFYLQTDRSVDAFAALLVTIADDLASIRQRTGTGLVTNNQKDAVLKSYFLLQHEIRTRAITEGVEPLSDWYSIAMNGNIRRVKGRVHDAYHVSFDDVPCLSLDDVELLKLIPQETIDYLRSLDRK